MYRLGSEEDNGGMSISSEDSQWAAAKWVHAWCTSLEAGLADMIRFMPNMSATMRHLMRSAAELSHDVMVTSESAVRGRRLAVNHASILVEFSNAYSSQMREALERVLPAALKLGPGVILAGGALWNLTSDEATDDYRGEIDLFFTGNDFAEQVNRIMDITNAMASSFEGSTCYAVRGATVSMCGLGHDGEPLLVQLVPCQGREGLLALPREWGRVGHGPHSPIRQLCPGVINQMSQTPVDTGPTGVRPMR